MATVTELFDGRAETVADSASAEIPYLIQDAADESAVKTALAAAVAATYAGMTLSETEITERLDLTTWRAVARYETPSYDQADPPDAAFSFETGGQTQHITQSIETVNRYGPSATADLAGAIGYDGEQVQGVDITIPAFRFSELHYKPAAAVSQNYRVACARLTGKVNSSAFRGFSAGEVLFLGASGSRRGDDLDDDWEITYSFAQQDNETGLQVGTITGIVKRGWDYLWVQYAEDVAADASQLVKKPVAAYVEKVYKDGDFSALNI